jgi:hypothetical protein
MNRPAWEAWDMVKAEETLAGIGILKRLPDRDPDAGA